jgi:transposase
LPPLPPHETDSCWSTDFVHDQLANGRPFRVLTIIDDVTRECFAAVPDTSRGPAGLINGKAPGNASKLNGSQRQALAAIVERGPIPAIHEVVRWRLADLAQWIWEEFGISLSETTVGREVKALGFAKISARPRHYAQNELAIDDFIKKDFRPRWKRSAKASRPEPR